MGPVAFEPSRPTGRVLHHREGPERPVAPLIAAILGHHLDKLRPGELRDDEEIFIGNQLPAIGDRERAGRQIATEKRPVEDAVDRRAVLGKRRGKRLAEDRPQPAPPPLPLDRRRDRRHRAGELLVGRSEIGAGQGHHLRVEGVTIVHEEREHAPIDELAGVEIKRQIDAATVDPVIARLRAEDVVDEPGRPVLMGMPGEIDVDPLHASEDAADWIGVVVLEAPAHVPEDNDRLGPGIAALGHGLRERRAGIGGGGAAEGFGIEPGGEAGRDQADQADAEAADLADRPWRDLLPHAVKGSRGLPAALEIRREHRGFGESKIRLELLRAPVEVVIAERPSVVLKRVEQLEHQLPSPLHAHRRSLHDVADIDREGVRGFAAPLADAGGGAREAADIVEPLVAARGEDPAVEIGGVEDRHRPRSPQIGGAGHGPYRSGDDDGAVGQKATPRDPLPGESGARMKRVHREISSGNDRHGRNAPGKSTRDDAPLTKYSQPVLAEVFGEDPLHLEDRDRVVVKLGVHRRNVDLADHPRQPGARHRHDVVPGPAQRPGDPIADDRVHRHPARWPQAVECLKDS